MAPFDRSHTSSYSPSIVTMALSCIVCEIWRLIGRKSRNFYTQPVFITPTGGDPVGISWTCLMLIKLEWLGYRTVKKNYDNMLSRFHLIPERHGQTDRQTDWRTDRIAISISLVSVLTRDKNHPIFMQFCTQQQILNWMNVTWSKIFKNALDRLRIWQNVFLVFCFVLELLVD